MSIPVWKIGSDLSDLRVELFASVDGEYLVGCINKWFGEHPNAVIEDLRFSSHAVGEYDSFSVLLLYRVPRDEAGSGERL